MIKRGLALLLSLAFIFPTTPLHAQAQRLSIDARDIDLGDVIRLLAMQSGTNLVPDGSIKPVRVTLRLHDVSFDEALATLTQAYGLQAHRDGRIILVGDAAVMNRRYPDQTLPSGTKTVVFPLGHAKPDELKAPLVDALPTGTLVVCDDRTGSIIISANATTIERARRLIGALDAPAAGNGGSTSFKVVHLRNIKASDAVKALKGSVPDDALVADDRQNIVVVTGNDEIQTTAHSLLASIDNPGKQVMFEVRVADLSPQIDSSNVGVQVGGSGFGSGALAQIPYLLTRSSLIINAQLNALVQHGRASILAQPRIATLNNKEATLLVGETYPVVTTNLQTGYPTVTNVDIGVKLRLTPTIGEDGSITAELHPEYSQIMGFNNAFPIVANRKVDSTLRVRDGETIVLGGLFSDIDSDTVTKLPFLGDIPILGSVFRNRQRSHTRDEVVFYITPHIL
jgi:type II secretory pathway component GspD/PulD (secretin)